MQVFKKAFQVGQSELFVFVARMSLTIASDMVHLSIADHTCGVRNTVVQKKWYSHVRGVK